MDLEAPADAWYVWVGVALVSVAFAGVALSLPTIPPPDANAAANTIDRVAANDYGASATYDHDAEQFRVGPTQLWLRNQGGTSRATVAFGTMTLARYNESLEAVLYGGDVGEQFDDREEFEEAVEDARDETIASREQWRSTSGKLRVKRVTWGDTNVTLVDF